MNLFGYHLPLDGHIQIGNAASLGKLIGLNNMKPFGEGKIRGSYHGVKGEIHTTSDDLAQILKKVLNHEVLVSSPNMNANIHSVGIITGGANSEWKLAQKDGLSAYITGEMSEHDWHEARESNIVMMAGGHHATEQFGIQELMKKITEDLKLECFYIDSENPA